MGNKSNRGRKKIGANLKKRSIVSGTMKQFIELLGVVKIFTIL